MVSCTVTKLWQQALVLSECYEARKLFIRIECLLIYARPTPCVHYKP
jgi:hypothetical protein